MWLIASRQLTHSCLCKSFSKSSEAALPISLQYSGRSRHIRWQKLWFTFSFVGKTESLSNAMEDSDLCVTFSHTEGTTSVPTNLDLWNPFLKSAECCQASYVMCRNDAWPLYKSNHRIAKKQVRVAERTLATKLKTWVWFVRMQRLELECLEKSLGRIPKVCLSSITLTWRGNLGASSQPTAVRSWK